MFLKAAENYGVTKTDMFQTVDLFEGKTSSRPRLFSNNEALLSVLQIYSRMNEELKLCSVVESAGHCLFLYSCVLCSCVACLQAKTWLLSRGP